MVYLIKAAEKGIDDQMLNSQRISNIHVWVLFTHLVGLVDISNPVREQNKIKLFIMRKQTVKLIERS